MKMMLDNKAVLLVIPLCVGRPLLLTIPRRTIIERRWSQLAILSGVLAFHAIVVFGVIWLSFGFHYETFRQAEPNRDEMLRGSTIESVPSEGTLGADVRLANDYRV